LWCFFSPQSTLRKAQRTQWLYNVAFQFFIFLALATLKIPVKAELAALKDDFGAYPKLETEIIELKSKLKGT